LAGQRRTVEGVDRIAVPGAIRAVPGGYWSRRISDEQRLVCKVTKDEIRMAACRFHDER
jgi:toxin YoeB